MLEEGILVLGEGDRLSLLPAMLLGGLLRVLFGCRTPHNNV
jgi:hypothetical protein